VRGACLQLALSVPPTRPGRAPKQFICVYMRRLAHVNARRGGCADIATNLSMLHLHEQRIRPCGAGSSGAGRAMHPFPVATACVYM